MSSAAGGHASEFKNVIRSSRIDEAMPVDDYLRDLDRLIAATFTTRDRTTAAIRDGSAPLEYVKMVAKEHYYLGRWMTPEYYGLEVRNFAGHAYAEPDHGDKAEALFRRVALTASVQRRCREAIRNTMLLRDARSRALNRRLDEALAR